MPTVTDDRSASSSESTRMPFGSRVARMPLVRGLLPGCLAQRFLAREPDLARLVDLEHLHIDHVALPDHVGDLPHALVGELRDVHQAVGAGHDLDERAEVDHLPYRAAIDLADLRLRGETADPVDRALHGRTVGGGDEDGAVVLDIDLAARLFHDAADGLAPRTDEITDAVRLDAQRDDAGRVGRQFRAWRRQRLVHRAQDVEASRARLLERLLHDGAGHAADLDVHLPGG